MRILILGGPRTGKTTLAGKLAAMHGFVPKHTDDLIGRWTWSEASDEARLWLEQPGPWIIEGTAAVRALRKWLTLHPKGRPADIVYHGAKPWVPLTRGQQAMANGHATIWSEVRDELVSRGLVPVDF